jgi:hypothetical protein
MNWWFFGIICYAALIMVVCITIRARVRSKLEKVQTEYNPIEVFHKCNHAYAEVMRHYSTAAPRSVDYERKLRDPLPNQAQFLKAIHDFTRSLLMLHTVTKISTMNWHHFYEYANYPDGSMHGFLTLDGYTDGFLDEMLFYTPEAMASIMAELETVKPNYVELTRVVRLQAIVRSSKSVR